MNKRKKNYHNSHREKKEASMSVGLYKSIEIQGMLNFDKNPNSNRTFS
jgi:hypothetical protein